MAGLTTHVLDTTRGRPASGVDDRTARARGGRRADADRERAKPTPTGAPTRPLIAAAQARVGAFELTFHVGAYFREQGATTAEPPFLDVVPIRFAIADAKAHYHVPLVVTPWSYSTYRGS